MPDNATNAESWRHAYGGCKQILTTLAQASDEDGRLAARTWWVICMASRAKECKADYDRWRAEAAQQLPGQLTAEHTDAAVTMPGFEPMAQCLIDRGAASGIDVGQLLDRVEAAGPWTRAATEVEPLRHQLQHSFLLGRRDTKESNFVRRAFARGGGRSASARLAPSAAEMDIDELRVCQVWMYGLASRLSACQRDASVFATSAGMVDPNTPLRGYDEGKWDPTASVWRQMEMCVHEQASKAGTTADAVWRQKVEAAARS